MIANPSLDPKALAGADRLPLQLLPPVFNRETALALAEGAAKYGPWNWREQQVEMMTYIGAIKRHIDKIVDRFDAGDVDPSGAHHLGHIAANCAIVLDALKAGTLVDNRPPHSSAPVPLPTVYIPHETEGPGDRYLKKPVFESANRESEP